MFPKVNEQKESPEKNWRVEEVGVEEMGVLGETESRGGHMGGEAEPDAMDTRRILKVPVSGFKPGRQHTLKL